MSPIRYALSVIIVITGLFLAFYVGIYLMFVGGIVDIVDAVQEDAVEASSVAWGVVKIVFAGFAASVTFWTTFAIAYATWPKD